MVKNQKKQLYRGENSHFKPLWAIFIVLAILCIGSISAAETLQFDNVKNYDEETKTVTIVNTFGLGRDISTIQLKTPQNYLVGAGYQKVAEFEVDLFDDFYEDAFNKMEFYDLRDNERKFERDFDYKYKTQEYVEVNDYAEVCKGDEKGFCDSVIIGTHQELRIVWKDLNINNLTKGKVTVGIFTEVEIDDKVEWIPTMFGKEISEFASWTYSLNTNLLLYFALEEASGAIVDSTGNYTGTNFGATTQVTGKNNYGYDFDVGNSDWADTDTSIGITGAGERTLSAWVNIESYVAQSAILFMGTAASNSLNVFGLTAIGTLQFAGYSNDLATTQTIALATWTHVAMTYNSTELKLYINGTELATDDKTLTTGDSTLQLGLYNLTGGWIFYNGVIDEVAVWNRSLSALEISNLYNGGAGIFYGEFANPSPEVTLNSPADNINQSSPTFNFNCTASDDSNLANVSFYVDDVLVNTSIPLNATAVTFTDTYSTQGTRTWDCEACDNTSQCANATAAFTFTYWDKKPSVTLDTPPEATNFSTNNILFGGVVSDDLGVVNVSLIIDDVYIETNTSGINNSNYTFTSTTTDGTHTWNYQACDSIGQCTNGTITNFTTDTTNPAVIILSPVTPIASHVLNTNYTLNWSANDTNIDACVYQYEGVNHTLTCSDNTTFFNITNSANRTIIFYVNDTFGNRNTTIITWDYTFLETGSSFTASVFETMNYSFALNVTSYQSLTSFSAFLDHNGTTYSADSTCTSGDCVITAMIDIPLITIGSSSEDKTFFWRISLFNGTGTSNINTSTNTQTVTAVNFIECNTAPLYNNVSSVNFTILNETDRTPLVANFDTFFDYYLGTGSVTKSGNSSQTGGDTYEFCIDQNETFYVDSKIELSASSFDSRHYDFIKQIYTNITRIQPLYLLNSTLASDIIIEVKDQGLIPQAGIVVNISRFYPGEGRYHPVEIQITDEFGQILAKLVESDVKYKFSFYNQVGGLLKTSPDITIACRNAFCVVPFVIEDTTDDFERFDDLSTYTSTLSFDNSTNIFTFAWDDQRGESATTRLEVTRWQLNASSIICNTSSTSILSTISCDVGDQRASYKAQVFRTVDGKTLRIALLNVKVGDPASIYGVEGLLWVFILLFTCVGIGAFNPTVGAVLYGVGFVMMGVVGVVSMPIPVFFANVLLVILFIWGVNK